MCGIAGKFNLDRRPVDADLISKMGGKRAYLRAQNADPVNRILYVDLKTYWSMTSS